jgi:hypothetical protein
MTGVSFISLISVVTEVKDTTTAHVVKGQALCKVQSGMRSFRAAMFASQLAPSNVPSSMTSNASGSSRQRKLTL